MNKMDTAILLLYVLLTVFILAILFDFTHLPELSAIGFWVIAGVLFQRFTRIRSFGIKNPV